MAFNNLKSAMLKLNRAVSYENLHAGFATTIVIIVSDSFFYQSTLMSSCAINCMRDNNHATTNLAIYSNETSHDKLSEA